MKEKPYKINGLEFETQEEYREYLSNSEKYSNAYEPWTDEQDNELKTLVNKLSTKELALHFKRKTGAIRSRLKKLNLVATNPTDEALEILEIDHSSNNSNYKSKKYKSSNNESLYDQLRNVRTKLAREEKMSPFIIAHNASLEEMILKKPVNLNFILKIKGFVKKKNRKVRPKIFRYS